MQPFSRYFKVPLKKDTINPNHRKVDILMRRHFFIKQHSRV